MNLSVIHRSSVPSAIRSRGANYYSEKRVRIVRDNPLYLRGKIRGTEIYTVELRLKMGGDIKYLVASCDCPYSDRGEICKHIWATLIKVDTTNTQFSREMAAKCSLVHSSDGKTDEQADAGDVSSGKHGEINLKYDPSSGSYGVELKKSENRKPQDAGDWQSRLRMLADSMGAKSHSIRPMEEVSEEKVREINYFLDLDKAAENGSLVISFFYREKKKTGKWGVLRKLHPGSRSVFWNSLHKKEDREIHTLVSDLKHFLERSTYYENKRRYTRSPGNSNAISFDIPHLWGVLLPKLCSTGRFFLGFGGDFSGGEGISENPLAWGNGVTWDFKLRIEKDIEGKHWLLKGLLFHEDQERSIHNVVFFIGDMVIFSDTVAYFKGSEHRQFIDFLFAEKSIRVPVSQQNELMAMVYELPALPVMDIPDELKWEKTDLVPDSLLDISTGRENFQDILEASLFFCYEDVQCVPGSGISGYIADRVHGRLIKRNTDAERTSAQLLESLGAMPADNDPSGWILRVEDLSGLVTELHKNGWTVKAQGKKLRSSGKVAGKVSSGIDWFEMTATVDFDGLLVSFPQLLNSVKEGRNFLILDDGSVGLLPDEWLEKYSGILKYGKKSGNTLKYRKSHVAILDALLEGHSEIETDQALSRLRQNLKALRGIKPAKEPAGFQGELRGYQREGLGWLKFLTKFQLGGCLADDMGLGKTVQILAMLVWYYSRPTNQGPSLIVVPRSLIVNWTLEADRFSKLRVLDYSTSDRDRNRDGLGDYHIVLTTYAILRNDIGDLSRFEFEYAILDEAQAIKNESSLVSRASRQIRARHRLAVSGTPIENHLGELWSVFEFINPGFGGSLPVKNLSGSSEEGEEDRSLKLLARAISPFFLRRTKEQVLKDLPSKTEQTIYCDLTAAQKKKYEELKKYYRASLDKKIQSTGLKKSQMHVLEALLRLRQAACHTALIDSKNAGKHSAKTEALMEQVKNLASLGHKVLVFSQFTKLLGIVKGFMEKADISYEYLDGKTRKRQEKVNRFQNDDQCSVFLISLKAGGVGLNLTAAGYCFILDPWWNPAVEAQAVDRMHRIGQSKNVFAYRFIARNTVEEKILQLQQKKKKLSEGLISANSNLIKGLTQKDLDFLLS